MRVIERIEDMSCNGRLRLVEQRDGDIIIGVIPADRFFPSRLASVEFCASGGRSPRVLAALRELIAAMEQDNAERPL